MPYVLLKDDNNIVSYIYDASGEKLSKEATINGTTTRRYYCGSMEYDDTRALSLIHTEEGLVEVSGSGSNITYNYEYFLKDHLGNTRVVVNSSGSLLQRSDYYPFGLTADQYSYSTDNKYLYNGKELQQDLGLGWYDYGARFYDQQIARFTTVDPNAEIYHEISPYAYVENNPLNSIDSDGKTVTETNDSYIITGDDVYQYIGYLKEMSTGGYTQAQQSNMFNNLLAGLDAASKENGGKGGPMAATLGQGNAEGWGTPGFNKISSQNHSLYTPEETEDACKFMFIAAGGEIAGTLLGTGVEAYETYRAAKAGSQIFKSLGAAAEGYSLTNKAKKILGNLVDLSNLTLREGVKLRGGKTGNLNVIGEWLHDLPIGEVANKAAEGNSEALTAIKILKQAAQKSQKY